MSAYLLKMKAIQEASKINWENMQKKRNAYEDEIDNVSSIIGHSDYQQEEDINSNRILSDSR